MSELNIHEGWLTKKGAKIKNWKRRWFVLENGEMRYYVSQDKKSKPPKGRFSIKGISISMAETETKNFANCFQANTPNRIYYMYADDSFQLDMWKEKLILHGAVWEQKVDSKPLTDGSVEEGPQSTNSEKQTNPEPSTKVLASNNATSNNNNNNSTNTSLPTSNDNNTSTSQSTSKNNDSKTINIEEDEFDEKKAKEMESVLDSTIDDLKNFTTETNSKKPVKKPKPEDASFLTSLQKKIEKEL